MLRVACVLYLCLSNLTIGGARYVKNEKELLLIIIGIIGLVLSGTSL